MSVTIPSIEPVAFRAGTTVAWTKSDFPNFNRTEGYTTAKYTINGRSGSKTIEGTWSSDDNEWTFELAAGSNDLSAGTYTLYGFVQNSDSDVQPVYEGTLEVKASLATAAQVDTRTHVKIVLDAIEATMQRRATREQESTQLPNGVAISLLKPADLIKWYEHYKYLYSQELDTQRVRNGGSRPKILPTFLPTS